MKYSKSIKLFAVLLIFSLTVVSCGDDPSSVEEEPPAIPTVQETIMEPDLSYFENNNPQKNADNITTENFNTAKIYATGLSSFALIAQIYSSFLTEANQEDAEFVDGQWVWDYTYNFENESASIVLIAEEGGSETTWSMTWSYDDGEGNAVEDYTLFEGSIANDGSSGSWTFNALDENSNVETPALITNWVVHSDTEVNIDTDIYDEEGNITETFSYEQNGQEYSLSLTGENTDNDILVYWNTDSMTGYYQLGADESERNCWDSEFQDIECS